MMTGLGLANTRLDKCYQLKSNRPIKIKEG
jgi:hypothetical protein